MANTTHERKSASDVIRGNLPYALIAKASGLTISEGLNKRLKEIFQYEDKSQSGGNILLDQQDVATFVEMLKGSKKTFTERQFSEVLVTIKSAQESGVSNSFINESLSDVASGAEFLETIGLKKVKLFCEKSGMKKIGVLGKRRLYNVFKGGINSDTAAEFMLRESKYQQKPDTGPSCDLDWRQLCVELFSASHNGVSADQINECLANSGNMGALTSELKRLKAEAENTNGPTP